MGTKEAFERFLRARDERSEEESALNDLARDDKMVRLLEQNRSLLGADPALGPISHWEIDWADGFVTIGLGFSLDGRSGRRLGVRFSTNEEEQSAEERVFLTELWQLTVNGVEREKEG